MIQIVYASAATQPFPPEALATLLRKARTRNALYQVTGMLLYHTGSFLQVLEGPETGVQLIFQSIQRDPRHGSTRILMRETLQTREFPDWSMGFLDTSALASSTPGLVDYRRAVPRLTLDSTQAKAFLRFFQQGLCRQTVSL